MPPTVRHLAVASLIFTVFLGAEVFGQDFAEFGDCSDFGELDLGEFERPASCNASEVFECALSLALDEANGIERCDRKITAIAYIGGELSKAREIHGERIDDIGQDLLVEAIKGLERIPDPHARLESAWAIAISHMNGGLTDEARRLSRRLPALERSLVLSWGAWSAALRCDEKLVPVLLEEAKEIADSLRASAGKVRAYIWISWVYHLMNSKKPREILDLAKTTLDDISWWDDAKSLWSAKALGKIYYTIGLFGGYQNFEAQEYLDKIEDPYRIAYVLSWSARMFAILGNDEKAGRFVMRADSLLMDYEDRYKRDGLLAVLEPVRLMLGEPSRIAAIADPFDRTRAFQRMASVLIDRRLGSLPRECTN